MRLTDLISPTSLPHEFRPKRLQPRARLFYGDLNIRARNPPGASNHVSASWWDGVTHPKLSGQFAMASADEFRAMAASFGAWHGQPRPKQNAEIFLRWQRH